MTHSAQLWPVGEPEGEDSINVCVDRGSDGTLVLWLYTQGTDRAMLSHKPRLRVYLDDAEHPLYANPPRPDPERHTR